MNFTPYFAWLFFCYLIGKAAKFVNRDFWKWALLATFISPLFAGLALLIVEAHKKRLST